jgi:hypothetical protein
MGHKSNEKTQNKDIIYLDIFKKVTPSKNQLEKHFFGSKLSKNKDFLKILKTDDDLNYLAKSVEQFFQNLISMHHKV